MKQCNKKSFRTVSFQKVVKPPLMLLIQDLSFRTVSFQKVVKPIYYKDKLIEGFRTVSFQKVVKLEDKKFKIERVLELCHFRR